MPDNLPATLDFAQTFGTAQAPPTAAMTVSAGKAGVFPVSFGYYPSEGSRAVSAQYDWTAQTSYTEDLSQLVARGIETTIQGVYVDNSTVAQYVTIAVAGSGQILVVQPYSQGIFPLFFTGTPMFSISVPATASAVTRLTLLNVPPQSVGIWAGAPGGSALVGPFLPLAGGSVSGPTTFQTLGLAGPTTATGPLIWTATSATTARSAQNRSADVANVLDFAGADPTGATDSSAAFNAAAATLNPAGQNKDIYVPPGKYRINNQITLVNGQCLFGDGRGSTQLFCDGNFNMAASSVILLATTTQSRDAGSTIAGLTISMIQNMSATLRSQMVLYPPVILAQANCGRWKLLHSRIEGANVSYSDGGNNVVFSIWDLELGAFGTGLSIGMGATGPQDFCHIHGLHFWNFGIPMSVFNDGNTVCMHIGRCDGLNCADISDFCGQIIVDSAGSASTVTQFANLMLDADNASITFNGGLHHLLSNVYSSAGTSRGQAAVTVNGGTQVAISNWYSHNSSPFPMFNVTAGELSVENAFIRHYAQSSPIGQTGVGNALLKVSAATVWAATAGPYTSPLFVQGGGTSRMRINNLTVDNLGNVNSGTAVSFGNDALGNLLGPVVLPAGWNNAIPYGNPPIGNYGAVIVAPNDNTSMQTGANSFSQFGATQHFSTAFGDQALSQALDGSNNNTAFGAMAGYGVTSGANNTFVGSAAGYVGPITGNGNTCAGMNAGRILTTGANNTIIGFNVASASGATSSGNIYIGAGGGALGIPGSESNALRIGDNAYCTIRATAINTAFPKIFLDWMPLMATYANDAAAATGGVGVGQLYRNGSVVQIRIV